MKLVAQRSCGCPWKFQNQVEFAQPRLTEGVPAHGGRIGLYVFEGLFQPKPFCGIYLLCQHRLGT